ncbi:MAG TPA: pirin family protein, partial [Candidatus Tenderia sp.]|nr:pirin family protein [Candidatus Tenderia sp.]
MSHCICVVAARVITSRFATAVTKITTRSRQMATSRTAHEMKEGDGVTVKRLMPVAGWRNFDPFVLWDDFTIRPGNGFPDHPHRGFEAITYLLSGAIEHKDNLGNHSTVFGGGAQRFTAGRGLVHSEMPNQTGTTRGIQLWINLPKRLKQIEPAYQQVNDAEFPVKEMTGIRVKTLVGEGSPLMLKTPIRYIEVNAVPGAQFTETVPAQWRGFIYIIEGRA